MFRRLGALALPAWIVLAFWAGDGVLAGYSGDDLMNLHGHWMTPYGDLAAQLFIPAEDGYRPLGGLAYRVIFGAFGLHPLHWRVFCFAVLALDLALVASLLLRLTGSRSAAAAGSAAIAYQARMADLYYNGGAVYELLCCAAMLVAMRVYVDADTPSRLEWKKIAAIVGGGVAAWGAKEMAAALPLLLLLWGPLVSPRQRLLASGPNNRNVSVAALGLFSIVFTLAKASAANPLQDNAAYRLTFSIKAWVETTAHYLDQLFYQVEFFDTAGVALVFAGLCVAGLLIGSAARFAVAWIVVSALPIAFIPARSGFAYFIPSIGWALLLATVWAKSPLRRIGPWASALVVALALAPFHWQERASGRRSVMEGVDARESVVSTMAREQSALCSGAGVVIEGAPFLDESVLFAARLLCRRRDLIVRRGGSAARHDEAAVRFQGLEPRVSQAMSSAPPVPAVVRFEPELVRPGERFRIEADDFPGTPIDVAYIGGTGYFSQVGVIEGFAELDAWGTSEILVPADQSPGTNRVTHIRGDGAWRAAGARLVVLLPR